MSLIPLIQQGYEAICAGRIQVYGYNAENQRLREVYAFLGEISLISGNLRF